MDMKLKIQATGATDVGKARTGNEDAFFCGQMADGRFWLAFVIDGCGGHKGGAQAAQMTRDGILQNIQALDPEDAGNGLKVAVIAANNKVHETRRTDEQLCEMCCVATAVLIDRQREVMHMVHVGDTRLYASHDNRIIKLSHDHSPIGREEELGLLTETQAMRHPHRNIIERGIGEKYLEPDTDYVEVRTFPLSGGLTMLLCSDGLCDMITSAQMTDILQQEIPVEERVRQLIEAANEAGGKDNITVVVLQTDDGDNSGAADRMNGYATLMNPNRTPDLSGMLEKTKVPSLDTDEHETVGASLAGAQEQQDTGNAEPSQPEELQDSQTPQDIPDGNQDSTHDVGAIPGGYPITHKEEMKNLLEDIRKKINGLYYILLAMVLLFSACTLFGYQAWNAQKQRVIELQDEVIRNEINVRQLQDSIVKLNGQAVQHNDNIPM